MPEKAPTAAGAPSGLLPELISGGLIDELAQAARTHHVMITLSVYPDDESDGAVS